MKPYRRLPIAECGEPLVAIPRSLATRLAPHPYLAAGAPYEGLSPWQLRSGVVEALERAAARLPGGLRFVLYDAYRPVAVQSFMVTEAFKALSGGLPPEAVDEERRQLWLERTFRIWAEPSEDPNTPPPHSTGAAIDLTLAGADGVPLDMGSPIDENSDRSLPDYFRDRDPEIHRRREWLHEALAGAGFRRHPEEWWHFSLGDQLWAFLLGQDTASPPPLARYGRADGLSPNPGSL